MDLLEVALFFCPGNFRTEYEGQLRDQFKDGITLAQASELAAAGIALWLEATRSFLLFGIRSLGRQRGSVALAILTLAVAVGMDIAIASIFDGVVIRALPYPSSNRLFFLQESDNGRSLSYPDSLHFQADVGSDMEIALSAVDSKTARVGNQASEVSGAVVSPNYLSILGVSPLEGRLYSTSAGDVNGVIISARLAQKLFGETDNVLGRPVELDGRLYTIIGVLPTAFQDPTAYGLQERDYWLVIDRRSADAVAPGNFNYNVIGRVRSGVDLPTAVSESKGELVKLLRTHPGMCCAKVVAVYDVIIGPAQTLVVSLFIAVSIVLLIACVNVTHLQLSRFAARREELITRIALGTPPTRIVSEIFIESCAIATAGNILGIGAAVFALKLFQPIGHLLLPRWDEVSVSGAVLLYALLLIPIIALMITYGPASVTLRRLAFGLRPGAASAQPSSLPSIRSLLLVSEIALAVPLVIVAALVTRSLVLYTDVDLGFRPASVYAAPVRLPSEPRYASDAAKVKFIDDVVGNVSRISGVAGAAGALQAPFFCCSSTSFVFPEDQTKSMPVLYNSVTPGYFWVLKIPLLSGRYFDYKDTSGTQPVAIVDREFAVRYFGTVNCLGKEIIPQLGSPKVFEIVGVVDSVRNDFGKPFQPLIYLPMTQRPDLRLFLIREGSKIGGLSDKVARTLLRADPEMQPPTTLSYGELIATKSILFSARAGLFGLLCIAATILALAGVYALTAYSVQQRLHELALRRALGATNSSIVATILRQVAALTGIGLLIGLAILLAFGSGIDALLYQTRVLEPSVIGGVAASVLICVLIAGALPVVLANREEPAVFLKYE